MDDDELFPPGDYIKEELEARDWSVEYFAQVTGIGAERLLAILQGARLTTQDATAIGETFGTGPELWISIQAQHDADLESRGPASLKA